MAEERHWLFCAPVKTSGSLTNGSRTLNIWITSPSAETSFGWDFEIYEDGEFLSKQINHSESVFPAGLSAELNILLLDSMEILTVSEGGKYR
jgi:hypothetical protein